MQAIASQRDYPFYGVEKESYRWKIIERGAVHQMVKLIQTCNWKSLAGKMDGYDRKTSEDR